MTAPRMAWRVVIADDEPLARERVRQLLARHPTYVVVAECEDAASARDAIGRERADLVFLDISMPGESGVELAEALADTPDAPAVVFVTAHEQFALRAFEVSALDYLVKPVDRERFDAMLARVERRLGAPTGEAWAVELRAVLAELRGGSGLRRRFVVRGTKGHYFVRTDDIETVTAEGNYVALSAGGRAHLVRETLKSFLSQVDPAVFCRVHRSAAVNVDRIARVEPLGHGEYRLIMQSGARLESSRAYGEALQALLR